MTIIYVMFYAIIIVNRNKILSTHVDVDWIGLAGYMEGIYDTSCVQRVPVGPYLSCSRVYYIKEGSRGLFEESVYCSVWF